jgi:hypothetical protein
MLRAKPKVIQAHITKRSPALRPKAVKDPRARRGKRYSLVRVWRTTLLALCLMSQSVRRATAVGRDLEGRLTCGIGRTALSGVMSRLAVPEVRGRLHAQVHEEMRRKSLRPVGLPVGVAAIDGKTVWTGDEKVNAFCQRSHKEDGTPYWHFRVVRAVLVSAAAPVCIDQAPIPAATNDMGVFPAFLDDLLREYGRSRLFEVLTMDAGFCSEENARLVDKAQLGYVFGLKGNQPELLAEARRVLVPLADTTPPHAVSEWEREKGKRVQRRFWRTREMAGWLDWSHLRQVWLVRRVEQVDGEPEVVVDERFFVTNLPVGRLSADQCLHVVRSHWRIENGCYGTIDVQWKEDRGYWTRIGNGLLVCSLLRMIAYNVVWLLRAVYFRKPANRNLPWQELRDLVRDALVVASYRLGTLVLKLV